MLPHKPKIWFHHLGFCGEFEYALQFTGLPASGGFKGSGFRGYVSIRHVAQDKS
jgi:hypothetical protein